MAGWGDLWAEGDIGIGKTFTLRLDVEPYANVSDFHVYPMVEGALEVTPASQVVDLVEGEVVTLWWNATAAEGTWRLGFHSEFDEPFSPWGKAPDRLWGYAYPTGAWAKGDAYGTPPEVQKREDTSGWHGWTRTVGVRHATTWDAAGDVVTLTTMAASDAPWNDDLESHRIEMRFARLCHWPPGADVRWKDEHPQCPPPYGSQRSEAPAATTTVAGAVFEVPLPRHEEGEYKESRVVQLFYHTKADGAPVDSWSCYWTAEFAWQDGVVVIREATAVDQLQYWLPCDAPNVEPHEVMLQAEPYDLEPCTYPVGYGYPMIGSAWAPERVAAAKAGTLWWQVGGLDPGCPHRPPGNVSEPVPGVMPSAVILFILMFAWRRGSRGAAR